MTFHQLNEHAEKLELEGMAEAFIIPEGAKAGPEEILQKICGIYQKVRPFLEVVASLFFIPKKWRDAIKTFMSILDGLCPGAANPDL